MVCVRLVIGLISIVQDLFAAIPEEAFPGRHLLHGAQTASVLKAQDMIGRRRCFLCDCQGLGRSVSCVLCYCRQRCSMHAAWLRFVLFTRFAAIGLLADLDRNVHTELA